MCSFRGRTGRAFCCSLLDFQSQVAVWGSLAGASAQPGLARLEAGAVSESGWPVAALENYLEFQRIKWTQVLCVLEKCFSNCGSQPISIRMTWGVYYRNKFLGPTQTSWILVSKVRPGGGWSQSFPGTKAGKLCVRTLQAVECENGRTAHKGNLFVGDLKCKSNVVSGIFCFAMYFNCAAHSELWHFAGYFTM